MTSQVVQFGNTNGASIALAARFPLASLATSRVGFFRAHRDVAATSGTQIAGAAPATSPLSLGYRAQDFRHGWNPQPDSIRGSLSRQIQDQHRSGRDGAARTVSSRVAGSGTTRTATVTDQNVGQSVGIAGRKAPTPQTLASVLKTGLRPPLSPRSLPQSLMARSNG